MALFEQLNLNKLSAVEQEIYRFIVNHLEKIPYMRVRDIADDAHVAGGGRIEGIQAGRGAVIGSRPVAGEQRAEAAVQADPGVAPRELAGAVVERQRALDLEHGAHSAAQVFAAAKADHRAVVRHALLAQARTVGGGGRLHVFGRDVQAAIQLDTGLGLGAGGACRQRERTAAQVFTHQDSPCQDCRSRVP